MPAISALYGGLIGILLLVLIARIPDIRLRHKIGLGHGDNPVLERLIRAHGNAVEWGLPAILLLLIAELNRAPVTFLHVCGIGIVVGRVLHAIGLWSRSGASPGRFLGSLLTWAAVLVLGIWNVWAFVRLALV